MSPPPDPATRLPASRRSWRLPLPRGLLACAVERDLFRFMYWLGTSLVRERLAGTPGRAFLTWPGGRVTCNSDLCTLVAAPRSLGISGISQARWIHPTLSPPPHLPPRLGSLLTSGTEKCPRALALRGLSACVVQARCSVLSLSLAPLGFEETLARWERWLSIQPAGSIPPEGCSFLDLCSRRLLQTCHGSPLTAIPDQAFFQGDDGEPALRERPARHQRVHGDARWRVDAPR